MPQSQQRHAEPSTQPTAVNRSQNFRTDRRRIFFRTLAKLAYPKQTAYELRRLTRSKYGERTIYDWIAGHSDAPMSVCMQIIADILSDE